MRLDVNVYATALAALAVACGSKHAPKVSGSAGSAGSALSAGSADSDTGSGSAGSNAGSAAPATAGMSVRQALVAAAQGKPLLFALDDKGQLIARSLDGSVKQSLAPGPYGDALLDDQQELIWLRGDTSLDVVDLRAPAPAHAKQLVTISPAKAMEKLGDTFTEPPKWTMADFVVIKLETECSVATGLELKWANGGAGTLDGAEGIKVVAKDWFAAEEHRGPRADLPKHPTDIPGHVHVPDRSKCIGEYGDECGTSVAFGAAGRQLVVVAADADRCPSKRCAVLDPKTKKLAPVPGADTADDAETCGPYRFDPSGTSYLVDDMACSPEGTCTSVGLEAIGWLDGTHVVQMR